jgi:SAM-dependent methyltransferase
VETKWYEHFFDEIYVDNRAERVDIEKTCDYLLSQFKVAPGALIFDQCCGTADVSRALAQRGYRIIGIDLSTQCIEKARNLAHLIPSHYSYQRADAFQYIAHPQVDAAFNWYTSFGYTDNDQTNSLMIKNAHASLKKGGVFVLDYTNPAYIFQNYKPHIEIEIKDRSGKITKDVEINMSRGMIITHWHYEFPEFTTTKFGESKIYFPHTLKEMFLQAGFSDVKLHGNIGGEIVNKDSPRNIVVGRK